MITIYRLVDSSGHTFYVGITTNTKTRERQHKHDFKRKFTDIKLIPICNSNSVAGFLLEWYFIDFFKHKYTLLNKRNLFTKCISDKLNLIDFCLLYKINHVEILDFSIFIK
jgi:hypothetical protein